VFITKKICIAALLFSSIINAGQDLQFTFNRINDQHIEHYINKVKVELNHNEIHRKVIVVGALAGLGYVTYQLLYGGQTPPVKPMVKIEVPKTDIPITSEPLITDVEKPVEKKEQSILSLLTPDGIWNINNEGAKNRAKDNLSLIPWVYAWAKENFYTVVQQTAVLALFTGLNNSLGPISKYITYLDGAADKFVARIFHAGNLAWFLKRHTQLSLLFNMMEFHAAKLENCPVTGSHDISLEGQPVKTNQEPMPLTQEERIYHIQQLQRTWNIVIKQGEYVLGFMAFSSSQSKWYSLATLQAQALQETIKQEFDQCALVLENAFLNAVNNQEMTVLSSLQLLHLTIEQDLNAFAELEKLKPY